MKKNLKLMGGIFILLLFFAQAAIAQDDDVDSALDDSSKLKGLHVGSYFGLNYNNGWYLEFSPGAGYKITDWLIAGGGLSYFYASSFDFNQRGDKISSTAIGPRLFVKANVFSQFYAIGEYQFQSYKSKYKDASGNVVTNFGFCQDCDPNSPNYESCIANCSNKNESVLYLGGGYTSQFGKQLGFYTEFIIDVLYDRLHSPRSSPYTVRVGVFYTF